MVSKVTTPPAAAPTIAIIISFVIFALRLLKYQKIISFSVSLISLTKKDNYDFIRYFFSDEEIKNYFKDINKTIFYDFDGLKTNQEKFITIFELYGLCIAQETSLYIEELLKNEKNPILLCYEKGEDFCHRHVLAEFIQQKYGVQVRDIKIDRNLHIEINPRPQYIGEILKEIMEAEMER